MDRIMTSSPSFSRRSTHCRVSTAGAARASSGGAFRTVATSSTSRAHSVARSAALPAARDGSNGRRLSQATWKRNSCSACGVSAGSDGDAPGVQSSG
jgi:hypothetical protein